MSGFGLDRPPGMGRLTPDSTKLRVLNGPKAGQTISLDRMKLLFGRNAPPHFLVDVDLTPYETGQVSSISRYHAEIYWAKGELYIIDLQSMNGTAVDGQSLVAGAENQPSAPILLRDGSKIKLGSLELEVIYG